MNNGVLSISYEYFPLDGEQFQRGLADNKGTPVEDDDWGYNPNPSIFIPCEDIGICLKRSGKDNFQLQVDLEATLFSKTTMGLVETKFTNSEVFDFDTFNYLGGPSANGSVSWLLAQANPVLLDPGSAQNISQSITIDDVLVIDQDYTFTSASNSQSNPNSKYRSRISMGPQASIVVNSGATLTIDGDIYGCAEMWHGIQVREGARLIIKNSNISDAKNAISTRSNQNTNHSFVYLENNKFINNYTSLLLEDPGVVHVIKNNLFTADRLLRIPYQSEVTDIPFCGIAIEGTDVSFLEENNIFENLANGIVVMPPSGNISNAEVKSRNSIFRNLGAPQGQEYKVSGAWVNNTLVNGTGIHSVFYDNGLIDVYKSSFLNFNPKSVGGTTGIFGGAVDMVVNDVTINGVALGVQGYDVKSFDVKNCKIGDLGLSYLLQGPRIDRAILMQNSTPTLFEIKGNRIFSTGSSVQIENSHLPSTFAVIADNTVNVWAANGIGLDNTTGYVTITKNKINPLGFTFYNHKPIGINLQNSHQAFVFDNNISTNITPLAYFGFNGRACHNAQTGTGIQAIGGANNFIQCNLIDLIPDPDPSSPDEEFYCDDNTDQVVAGYHLYTKEETLTTISSNIATGLRHGKGKIAFEGANQMMSQLFAKNDMSYLFLKGTAAKIGTQVYTENIFNIDAFNDGNPLLSLFTVDSQKGAKFLPQIVNPSQWFDDIPQTTTGSPLPACESPFRYVFSSIDSIAIEQGDDGQGLRSNKEMSIAYIAHQRIYNAYKENENITDATGMLHPFIQRNQSGVIGKINEIQSMKEELHKPSAEDNALLKEKKAKIHDLQFALNALEAQLIEVNGKDAALLSQIGEKSNEIASLQQDLLVIYKRIRIEDSLYIERANHLNNSLPINQEITPQKNQKRINEVYFNSIAKAKWPIKYTPEQWNTIVEIANQCTYIGGDAVYEARSLYRLRYPDVKFDDSTFCYIAFPPGGKIAMKHNVVGEFKVYPNPANDFLIVESRIAEANLVSITDITGKILLKKDWSESNNMILTEGLQNGMYFVSLLDAQNRILKTQKIIISKQ